MARNLYAGRINNINEKRKRETGNDSETIRNFTGTVIEGIGEAIEDIGKWLKNTGRDIRYR
jgi:hypothetical protein